MYPIFKSLFILPDRFTIFHMKKPLLTKRFHLPAIIRENPARNNTIIPISRILTAKFHFFVFVICFSSFILP